MTVEAVAAARTLLFVPADRPDRFEKARCSGADAVVIDLEDSVPPAAKAQARAAVQAAWSGLATGHVPVVIRINAPTVRDGRDDTEWLLSSGVRPAAVMVPKAESVDALATLHETTSGLPLLPLVETAAGYAALPTLAQACGLVRLVVGHIDFLADLGMSCDDDQRELDPLRLAVAVATRLNGLAPAVDGVTTTLGDEEGLRRDVRRAVRFGFGGKLCIHPSQVAVAHAALMPDPREVDWARKVMAADHASQGMATQVDGRMVDAPVVAAARRTLARARAASPALP